MKELIRTWKHGDFMLKMYDTYKTDRNGKTIIGYQFYHGETLVFEGQDYCPSPLHSIDGDESLTGLLTFLSLRPGDTDKEYFDSYTPEQMEFAIQHGEELSMVVYEIEENLRLNGQSEIEVEIED